MQQLLVGVLQLGMVPLLRRCLHCLLLKLRGRQRKIAHRYVVTVIVVGVVVLFVVVVVTLNTAHIDFVLAGTKNNQTHTLRSGSTGSI